jgi:hypothetical protein
VVAYELLFEEDENLDQGPFAECVRDQHLKSRTAFVEEVRRALMTQLDGVVGPVTLRQTVDAFRTVDADMKPKLVNEYLCRGFEVPLKVRLGLSVSAGASQAVPPRVCREEAATGCWHRWSFLRRITSKQHNSKTQLVCTPSRLRQSNGDGH